MSYCYYQLQKTGRVRLAQEFKKLREQMKTFRSTLEKPKFSGENPVLISDQLTKFAKKYDTLGVSRAHAFLTLPELLNSRAERYLRSIRNGARSRGATYLPGAVKYLLCIYATSPAIRDGAIDL